MVGPFMQHPMLLDSFANCNLISARQNTYGFVLMHQHGEVDDKAGVSKFAEKVPNRRSVGFLKRCVQVQHDQVGNTSIVLL